MLASHDLMCCFCFDWTVKPEEPHYVHEDGGVMHESCFPRMFPPSRWTWETKVSTDPKRLQWRLVP